MFRQITAVELITFVISAQQNGIVWYDMVYLFFQKQYNVYIYRNITIEMSPYILPMKGKHHIIRRLLYHNDYYIKYNRF